MAFVLAGFERITSCLSESVLYTQYLVDDDSITILASRRESGRIHGQLAIKGRVSPIPA